MISTIRLSLVAGILSLLQVSVCNAGVTVLEIKKITTGGGYSRPQWSPDGKKIYVQAADAGVVAMNADGTNIVKLSDSDGYDRKFAVSPDGTKILYEFNETKGENSNLWIMNSDGTGKKRVAENAGDPSWSPDRTKFTFRMSGIMLSNADGSETKRLVNGGGTPVFLGNDKIVYQVIVDSKPGLQLIDLTGKPIKFYPAGWTFSMSTFDSKIVFTKSNLVMLDTVTGSQKNLITATHADSGSYFPEGSTFSPDGKMIAYAFRLEGSDSGGTLESDIYLLNVDGTVNVNVTKTPEINEIDPVWAPDGSRLLFTDKDELNLYIATITKN